MNKLKIGNKEIIILFWLLESRGKAEYIPIPILCSLTGLPCQEVKLGLLYLEKNGLVEAVVDDKLTEDARFKYALTPPGLAFVQEVLREPQKPGIVHKSLKPS